MGAASFLLRGEGMRCLAGLIVIAMTAACLGEDDDDEGASTTSDPLCTSGLRWSGGNAESPLMHPGGDCIGCHVAEGPRFIVAGTVFGRLDEPDDCLGVAGVTVTITDAAGATHDVVTNSAGNFFISARTALTLPIRAHLAFEGRERTMTASQQTGACATCHTATPSDILPGRIVAP